MRTKISAFFVRIISMILLLFITFQTKLNAQSTSSTTTHTETSSTSINPMVWYIGGGVVLLIILIAVLSGRNKTTIVEKTTHTIE